jgi:predicted Fe-S protein YdhL (DUF1289 family)
MTLAFLACQGCLLTNHFVCFWHEISGRYRWAQLLKKMMNERIKNHYKNEKANKRAH